MNALRIENAGPTGAPSAKWRARRLERKCDRVEQVNVDVAVRIQAGLVDVE